MKKNFVNTGLVLIGIFLFQSSFAQENFISGYILKEKGDTIWGLIDYRNWGINPKEVGFIMTDEDKPQYYKPLEIIEFGVKDEIYLGAIIDVEISPRETRALTQNPSLNLRTDTIFLQTLYKGGKSLYFYRDQSGNDNYYIQQDSSIELLIYKKYIKELGAGSPSIFEYKKFQGQLAFYFKDCPSVESILRLVSYNHSDLIKAFRKYNECVTSEPDFEREKERVKIEPGVLIGASTTSLDFKSDLFPYLVYANYNISFNFTGGIFVDFIIPRNQGKWSINNEILFSSYCISGEYKDVVKSIANRTTTTELGYSYIKLNNLFRFKYRLQNVYVHVNGGISNGYAVAEKNIKYVEYDSEYHENKVEKALEKTRKLEQGFIIGSGIDYNQFSLEVRYEIGYGIMSTVVLNTIVKKGFLLVGYRF